MKRKTEPRKPEPLSMWEWGAIIAGVVFLCIGGRIWFCDWAENGKAKEKHNVAESVVLAKDEYICLSEDGKSAVVQLGPCQKKKARHTHNKDAAETAKLNHAMNVQHGGQ